MRKIITGAIACLVLAGGGEYAWLRFKAADQPPQYYTTEASRGELVQTVTATGILKPLLDILVSSQISGNIDKIFVDFNSPVKANQVIATLEPSVYRAAVESAQADLDNSKANYSLQKITLGRDRELLAKKLVPLSDYDTAAALVEEAAAQVKIKEAALESANTNLSHCTLYSPIDGMVISRNVDVGNTVAASLSAPTLFEIGNDLTKMQIDASVAEADVGNVRDGQSVNFTVDAYPNREFRGEVYQVRNAPQTQQNVVIYDVMIKVANAELKLKPGMTANVSIIIEHRGDALRLANSALRFRMPESGPVARGALHDPLKEGIYRTVYVLPRGDPLATPRVDRVRLGITDGTNTEILDGLKAGDVVITGIDQPDSQRAASSPFPGFRR